MTTNMTTKLGDLRKCQQDLAIAKQPGNHEEFQEYIERTIIHAQSAAGRVCCPWSGHVNHTFAEVWKEEFLNLWEKTLSRLRAEIEIAKDEARTEAEEVLEETEPIAYG